MVNKWAFPGELKILLVDVAWRVLELGSRGPIWIHWRPVVLFGRSVMSNTLGSHKMQCTRIPCPSLSPRVCSNLYPLSWWCHSTISSSVIHFSSSPQSFPVSGSFPMSQLFISGGQSMAASVLASVLPTNIQGWFPLGFTGLNSLQSKELSRVFSSTTVWKPQFFDVQPSLWSSSHICTWLLEKP